MARTVSHIEILPGKLRHNLHMVLRIILTFGSRDYLPFRMRASAAEMHRNSKHEVEDTV